MYQLLEVRMLDAEEATISVTLALYRTTPYFSVIPDFASLRAFLTNAPTARPELKTKVINGRFFNRL